MTTRQARRLVVAAAATLFISGWGRADVVAQPPPQVKQAPPPSSVGIAGMETFATYCAVCHGVDGRGHGPAAPALNMPVPDLTALASRQGGFKTTMIENTIRGSDRMPAAHGSLTMPIWGPIFRAGANNDQAVVTLRLKNLIEHLKMIQRPVAAG
jgi:mono/diheme cytochrome c family protein